MHKKIWFAVLVMGVLGIQSLAAALGNEFKDLPTTHKNYAAIMKLKEKGIISGYADGTFQPDKTVNRVEALKIILGSTTIITDDAEIKNILALKDVNTDQWYAKYLSKALALKIVQGYPDGNFRPVQNVNLVESLKILLLAHKTDLSKVEISANAFADSNKDEWYAKYLQYAKNMNLINGDSQNKIYPAKDTTRGELAEIAYRIIYVNENKLNKFEIIKNEIVKDVEKPIINDLTPDNEEQILLKVSIKDMAFTPANMTVGLGSKVAWINKEDVMHKIISNDGVTLKSEMLGKDQTYSHVFDKIGTFSYYCSEHPTMKGTITVKPAIEVPTI